MHTDRGIPEPSETVPDAAMDPPQHDPAPDHTVATDGASPPDEATMREWEGLAPDTMILIPTFNPPPMRCPANVWSMLVSVLDIGDADDADKSSGEVALFGGCWVPEQPPADDFHDGDLVVRLTDPIDSIEALARDQAADVEMLLAYQGRWRRVGQWFGVDQRWPHIVAPTAAAVMGLHCDLSVPLMPVHAAAPPVSSPPINSAPGEIAELLDAGLLQPGDELVRDRPRLGVRHTAHVGIDSSLVLADGRAYTRPTHATNALGGYNVNGWNAFRRISDGRTLGDLRAQRRAERGVPADRRARPGE